MSEETAYNPAYDDYTSEEYPPDWKARAKTVVDRDGYTCQNCGVVSTRVDDVYFDVDHIIPKSDDGSHARSNLQSLCPSCHAAKHPGNTKLAKRARKWERRNKRSLSRRLLRVLLVVPVLLGLLSSSSRMVTDEHGRKIKLSTVESVSNMPAECGVSVDVRVATLWDNSAESIQQVGLLAPVNSSPRDDSPVVKFVVWEGNDQPILRDGGSYRFIGALTDRYNGKMQLTVDSQSETQPL
jgi:5-methylcytosine-specific restriction endonuclease McrA